MFLSVTAQDPTEKNAIPIPLPEWSAPKGFDINDQYLLGYDIITHQEFIADSTNYLSVNESEFIEPFIPENLGIDEESSLNRSFSEPELVENTSTYPASANVKLFIKYPNTSNMYVGSGIMVSKNIVLTAGHCVYDQEHGGWATWIKVVPAYRNGTEPFGHAFATCTYSWQAWTENRNFEWDMGEIALDWCIGLQSSCFGFGTNTDDFFTSHTFHNYSYPAASPYDGTEMYYRKGNFDAPSTETLYFNNKSYGGQSGSGFYYKDADGYRYVYAVLSNSNPDRSGCTRITTQKFNYIKELVDKNQACSYTGIDDLSDNNTLDFQAYPNPVKERITVSLAGGHGSCTVRIYDILGKMIRSENIDKDKDSIILDVTDLMAGCYVISVCSGKTASSKTFIKKSY